MLLHTYRIKYSMENTLFFIRNLGRASVLKVSLLFLFSVVMRAIVYCVSIIIGWNVEYKLLIKEFLIKTCPL